VEKPFLSAIELRWVNDDSQTGIYAKEPLVPKPSAFEFAMTIEKLKEQIASY
jgi:hypothetical protein